MPTIPVLSWGMKPNPGEGRWEHDIQGGLLLFFDFEILLLNTTSKKMFYSIEHTKKYISDSTILSSSITAQFSCLLRSCRRSYTGSSPPPNYFPSRNITYGSVKWSTFVNLTICGKVISLAPSTCPRVTGSWESGVKISVLSSESSVWTFPLSS